MAAGACWVLVVTAGGTAATCGAAVGDPEPNAVFSGDGTFSHLPSLGGFSPASFSDEDGAGLCSVLCSASAGFSSAFVVDAVDASRFELQVDRELSESLLVSFSCFLGNGLSVSIGTSDLVVFKSCPVSLESLHFSTARFLAGSSIPSAKQGRHVTLFGFLHCEAIYLIF